MIMRESKKRRRKEEIIERREREGGGDGDRGHTPVREATVHYQRTTLHINDIQSWLTGRYRYRKSSVVFEVRSPQALENGHLSCQVVVLICILSLL